MSRWDNHPTCSGGCGELADECRCAQPNPLGSMRAEWWVVRSYSCPTDYAPAVHRFPSESAAVQFINREKRDHPTDILEIEVPRQ